MHLFIPLWLIIVVLTLNRRNELISIIGRRKKIITIVEETRMDIRKAKSKRKTILINHSQQQGYDSSKKNELYQFDMGLNSHIKHFIDIQKNKLKTLHKKTAKKVVGLAESNLLNFMKSRSKVYCLRNQQTTQPFHLTRLHKQVRRPELFDKNKLQTQIAREHKHWKVKTLELGPLLQVCLRETGWTLPNRKSEPNNSKMEIFKKQARYLPLSAHHRLNKMFY